MGPETLEAKQKAAIEEILKAYPEKAAKNREKHLGVGTPNDENQKTCGDVRSNKKNRSGCHEPTRMCVCRF